MRILTTDFTVAEHEHPMDEEDDVHRELRWYWRDHRFPRLGPLQRLRIERHNARVLERHLEEVDPHAVVWWSMGGMSLSLLEQVRQRNLPSVGVVQDDFFAYAAAVDGWQRLCRRLGPLRSAVSGLTGVPTSVELSSAAQWVFNSETMRRRASAHGIDVKAAPLAYPGVDPARFRPRPPRAWRGELLCLGRIDPRKGIGTAVRSLTAIPGASLRIVGDGDRRHLEALRLLADREGVGDRVSFTRATHDQVPAVIAAADALLFPVLWEEPWGLVPLEAMASGTPVIATGRGGSGEYLRDRENCVLFDPADDPLALAATVRELAADAGLRARLRACGLGTASGFSAESFNAAVLAAIVRAVR